MALGHEEEEISANEEVKVGVDSPMIVTIVGKMDIEEQTALYGKKNRQIRDSEEVKQKTR